MTLLAMTIAPFLALQSAGEVGVAIKNDDPETWTVEYPRVIQPLVASYRGCLTFSNRIVRGVDDFEDQHRADLPRCAETRARNIEEANALLAGAKTTLTPAEVDTLFERIGLIHIARGADLDNQFRMRVASAETAIDNYHESRRKGLVIELRDASVVEATITGGVTDIKDDTK